MNENQYHFAEGQDFCICEDTKVICYCALYLIKITTYWSWNKIKPIKAIFFPNIKENDLFLTNYEGKTAVFRFPLQFRSMAATTTFEFNPLYTDGLVHCYMLDEFICHFRGVGSILSPLFYFWWKILLAIIEDPDQKPHAVSSDLGLHCLPLTLLRVSR